jgi:hypothetical protein
MEATSLLARAGASDTYPEEATQVYTGQPARTKLFIPLCRAEASPQPQQYDLSEHLLQSLKQMF